MGQRLKEAQKYALCFSTTWDRSYHAKNIAGTALSNIYFFTITLNKIRKWTTVSTWNQELIMHKDAKFIY